MAGTTTPETPKRLGDMTISDLLGAIKGGGGFAGWLALALVAAQLLGCELPQRPELPKLPGRPIPKADVPNAIGRISMGNVGCTATIIGPVRETDKELSILTAAHCIKVGQTGTMSLKDGRKLNFKCVSRNAAADCAWLTAPRPEGDVPFAFLATTLPPKGAAVWHQGYGVDKPGNLEKGTFEGVSGDGQQCLFTLSVSSGDSGGGIIHTDDGHVLSPVCCTSTLSGRGRVYGSTPQNSAAIRPGQLADASDEPLYRPIIILPNPEWPEPPTG